MAAASCDDDTILLLQPDGGVRMFSAARPGDPPLLVADVLAEFPNCRVCRLDTPSSSPGRSACLSPHAALRPGTTYFLVEPIMSHRVDPGYCGFDPVTMEPVTRIKGPGAEPVYRPKSGGACGAAGQFPDFTETAGGYFPSGAQPGQHSSHSRNTSLSSSSTYNSSSSSSSCGGFSGCGSDTSSGSRRLTRGLTSPATMRSSPTHCSQSFRAHQMPSDAQEPLDISAVAARAAAAYGGNASPMSGMSQTGPYMTRTASWSAASAPGWADAYGAALSYETGAHDASPSRSSLDLESPPQTRSRHVSAEDAAAFEFIKQHNATTSSASRRFQRAPLPPRCSAQQQSPREQQTAADVLAASSSGRLAAQRRSSTRNKIVSLEDIVYGRVSS